MLSTNLEQRPLSRRTAKSFCRTVAAIALAACAAGMHPTTAAERSAVRADTHDRITSSVPIFDQLLIFGIPRGWWPAYEKVAPRKYVLEFVPDGQSVKSWHEMITVQGFRDMALNPDFTPETFLATTARRMKDLCGTSTVTVWLGERKVDTFDAHAAILGCANLPSSPSSGVKRRQGEVAYYLAIQGNRDLYVIQRAIRGNAFDRANPPINADNASEFMREIEPIKLCDHNLTPEQCWARSDGTRSSTSDLKSIR